MRWDALFADLESQAEALERAERAAEVGERARIELASLATVDRLRGALSAELRLTLAGGLALDGVLRRVGPDWLLLEEGGGREAVVVLANVAAIGGLPRQAASADVDRVGARLPLRSALREIARDRSPTRIHLTTGEALDATIDRVGGDFVDAARHAAGEPRRRGEVRDVLLVPVAGMVAVRRVVW